MNPIRLDAYDNGWYDPGGTPLKRVAWFFIGQTILGSSWIPFSSLRVSLLKFFGARIGEGVTIKPSVQVKYPWHLVVGDFSWIGERVWIDNLTTVTLGSHVCISQGVYLCTGNHDWTDPTFGLRIASIEMEDGAWAGARSILMPGTLLKQGAIAAAGSVVAGTIPAWEIHAGNPATFLKMRRIRSTAVTDRDHLALETLS